MIKIRKATRQDAHIIHKFIRDLAEFNGELEQVKLTTKDYEKYFSQDQPPFEVLLAETTEQKILGFTLWFESFSSWLGPCMFLDDLYIVPEMRKQGLGKLFFKELASIAKARNYQRIEWTTSKKNTSAQQFYKHIGAELLDDTLPLRLTKYDKFR